MHRTLFGKWKKNTEILIPFLSCSPSMLDCSKLPEIAGEVAKAKIIQKF
jgi:hypothetical protein